MVMDSGFGDFSGTMSGFMYGDSFSDHTPVNGFKLEEKTFRDHNINDRRFVLPHPPDPNPNNHDPSSSSLSLNGDSSEDSEIFSDIVLTYISQMLMEEDMEEKSCMYQESSALQAAEKPFYDILGEKYPPSPDQPPLYVDHNVESPDDNNIGGCYSNYNGSSSGSSNVLDSSCVCDLSDYPSSQMSSVSADYTSQSSFSSSNCTGSVTDGLEESPKNVVAVPDLYIESQPVWQFKKGVEEASRFLPNGNNFILDLENNVNLLLPNAPKEEVSEFEVKAEKKDEREYLVNGSRGRKNPHWEDSELEGRSSKQSAVYSEDTVRSEMFDMVLLCSGERREALSNLREALQNGVSKNSHNGQSKGSNGAKSRGKKKGGNKSEVVDLRTLLIHCAQAVAADDRRNANELLKQIRQHSSPFGDGSQRLAHYFAEGIEARLAGTGSQIYSVLSTKRTSAADILKAYYLYLATCPFKKISHFFANQTIINVAENATQLHIIDFGIYYGFQWPCLIQRLSKRPNGPPKLRITGIDFPQPGFRPAERVEETGQRLADYAQSFNVPFEYNPIARKWETIKIDELKIDRDEVLVVNCQYRMRNLVDETVVVDSPRNKVLNMIRKINPDVFIHGVVNGAYSAPFFVTRFREALFHFSASFDMLETNIPREQSERILIEREIFGREVLNVISCEGTERVERPVTYKQWQVRNQRAGFLQLPLNSEIMKKSRDRVQSSYHKDFVIDEDSQWMLQGWKGRILYAISTWRPNKLSY